MVFNLDYPIWYKIACTIGGNIERTLPITVQIVLLHGKP